MTMRGVVAVTPALLKKSSSPMATTREGNRIGSRNRVRRNSRPRKTQRCRANAASVPANSPMTVTNAATVTVPISASQKRPGTSGGGFPVRMSQKVAYHRSERPSGGKVSVFSELKVVITTITIGR